MKQQPETTWDRYSLPNGASINISTPLTIPADERDDLIDWLNLVVRRTLARVEQRPAKKMDPPLEEPKC